MHEIEPVGGTHLYEDPFFTQKQKATWKWPIPCKLTLHLPTNRTVKAEKNIGNTHNPPEEREVRGGTISATEYCFRVGLCLLLVSTLDMTWETTAQDFSRFNGV